MTNLRKLANGQACQVRLEGCLGRHESVVLAHYSLTGISGGGLKSPDLLGAYCCYKCHRLADGQDHIANLTRDDVRLALAEGVFRTQYQLIKDGVVRW
jgi:hypothetical protein